MRSWIDAVLIIVIILGLARSVFVTINVEKASSLIEKCEQNLPRDQHCKLIAVIDKGAE